MHFICPDCGFEKNGESAPQHCPVCEEEMVLWENPLKKDKRMTRKEMIGKLKEALGCVADIVPHSSSDSRYLTKAAIGIESVIDGLSVEHD